MTENTGRIHAEAAVGDVVVHDRDAPRIGDDGSPGCLPRGVEGVYLFEKLRVLDAKRRQFSLVAGPGVGVAVDAALRLCLYPFPQGPQCASANPPAASQAQRRGKYWLRGATAVGPISKDTSCG